jgi:hypothetical protein
MIQGGGGICGGDSEEIPSTALRGQLESYTSVKDSCSGPFECAVGVITGPTLLQDV